MIWASAVMKLFPVAVLLVLPVVAHLASGKGDRKGGYPVQTSVLLLLSRLEVILVPQLKVDRAKQV